MDIETQTAVAVDIDLSQSDMTTGRTTAGVRYAAFRNVPGSPTVLAFGEIADSLIDSRRLDGYIVERRGTVKAVAVRVFQDRGTLVDELGDEFPDPGLLAA